MAFIIVILRSVGDVHFFVYRLAKATRIMIALAIFLTYALQFYVPFEIIWNNIKHKFSSQTPVIEYLFRIALVVLTGKMIVSYLEYFTIKVATFITSSSPSFQLCHSCPIPPLITVIYNSYTHINNLSFFNFFHPFGLLLPLLPSTFFIFITISILLSSSHVKIDFYSPSFLYSIVWFYYTHPSKHSYFRCTLTALPTPKKYQNII